MVKYNIKEMNLYKQTNRFINSYNALKIKLDRTPNIEELSEFDHLHYKGTSAVDEAILKTKIQKYSKVLDVGSGIGGPARYISKKTGAKIYALELQKDLNSIANLITNDCNLGSNINHIKGDILNYEFKKVIFDNIVSWLSLYHIPKRPFLLKKLYNNLKVNGYFYAEDFFLKQKLSELEKNTLLKSFHANCLKEYNNYILDLNKNNFKIIEVTDLSKAWTKYTKKRYYNFYRNINHFAQTHDKITAQYLLSFYKLAYQLLCNNILGGIKFICKK